MILSRLIQTLEPLVSRRVYPLVLPERCTYPAIVCQHTAITEEPFVDAGQLIQRYRVLVRVYAEKYPQVFDLRSQIVSGIRQMPEFMEQIVDFDGYEPETKLFFWTMDFSLRDV